MAGWSGVREIIEFALVLHDDDDERPWRNKYFFRKTNGRRRWQWGYLGHRGVIWDKHPFATQREAKAAAREFDNQKKKEVGEVVAGMRAIADSYSEKGVKVNE